MRSHQLHWWTNLLEEERIKVEQWNNMSERELKEAGQSFDLLKIYCLEPERPKEEESEEGHNRTDSIKKLLDKQENFPR